MQFKEISGDINSLMLNCEVELIVNDLFNKLSNSMNLLTKKAYQRFVFRLNNGSYDEGDTESFISQILLEAEIYDTIKSWIGNLKKWFLDNIESVLNKPDESLQKSFLGDLVDNIETLFDQVKNKVSRLIFNIVSRIQTEAIKIVFKVKGIEKYQIVLSDNSNVCGKCQEMAGKVYNVNELNIGETAPPFHPNCGCTLVPYVDDEQEEESQSQERETNDNEIVEYVNASQLEYIGFNNVTDSMVKELNETLWKNREMPTYKYNITTKEQIAHFLAQCYVESGIWRIEIDWAGDNFAHIEGGADYRGAGAIHISHDYTYRAFFDYIGVDISEIGVAPYIYVDQNYYWESAGWYWSIFKDINGKITSSTTVEEITRIVNGGEGGLNDRKEAYQRACEILN